MESRTYLLIFFFSSSFLHFPSCCVFLSLCVSSLAILACLPTSLLFFFFLHFSNLPPCIHSSSLSSLAFLSHVYLSVGFFNCKSNLPFYFSSFYSFFTCLPTLGLPLEPPYLSYFLISLFTGLSALCLAFRASLFTSKSNLPACLFSFFLSFFTCYLT